MLLRSARTLPLYLIVTVAMAALSGCGNDENVQEVEGTLTAPGGNGAAGAGELATAPAAVSTSYAWDAPEGWTPQPASALRQANFTAGPDEQVEIYMTVLPGAGGGIAANVNRWRKQMGLEPLSEEGVAELPAITVLGDEAKYVDFEGTYTGMGDEQHEGYRMAGALLEQNGKAIFLKMVGPAEAVAAEAPAFETFAKSLRPAESASMGAAQASQSARGLPPGHPPIEGSTDSETADPATGLPPGHPPIDGSTDAATADPATGLPPGHPPIGGAGGDQDNMGLPPGHPPMDGAQSAIPNDAIHGEGAVTPDPDLMTKLRWEAPEGWERGADQPMRLVTYTMGESGQTECYITVLPGTGGGAAANINRWRKQMGQNELSNEEIGQLDALEVLGRPALYAAIEGDYTGMSGPTQADYVMLGLVSLLPGNSIFVKLIGPEEEALNQREAFLDFCRSLYLEGAGDTEAAPDASEPTPDAGAEDDGGASGGDTEAAPEAADLAMPEA